MSDDLESAQGRGPWTGVALLISLTALFVAYGSRTASTELEALQRELDATRNDQNLNRQNIRNVLPLHNGVNDISNRVRFLVRQLPLIEERVNARVGRLELSLTPDESVGDSDDTDKTESDNSSGKEPVAVDTDLPVGVVCSYMGTMAPVGWLLCNGATIPPGTEFQELRNLIGATAPDLRGRFIRGWDPEGLLDPDGVGRELGQAQEDMVGDHSHFIGYGHSSVFNLGADVLHTGQLSNRPGFPLTTGFNEDDSIDTVSGNPETRPQNISVQFIIKY